MIKDQFKVCPRCGKNVLKNKNICSFCGVIIKDKEAVKKVGSEDESGDGTGPKVKKYCPLCGKPPADETSCPNCGVIGICAFHVYSFFQDQTDSPRGCLRCGPKCSSCGTQTALVHVKKRALCTQCAEKFSSTGYMDKDQQIKTAETIKKVVTSLFTLVGLGGGIYLGMQPEMQKMLMDVAKTPILKGYLVTVVWGMLGLIAGSIVGSVIGAFIKA